MAETGAADDEATTCCPICLSSAFPPSQLPGGASGGDGDGGPVHGPCRHPLCRPCAERVLLVMRVPAPPHGHRGAAADDAAASVPTLGRCPVCRGFLDLFGLVVADDGSGDGPPRPAYPRDLDVALSPLGGMTFVESGREEAAGQVGMFSYHFPGPGGAGGTADGNGTGGDGSPNGGDGDDGEAEEEGGEAAGAADSAGRPLPYVDLSHPSRGDLGMELDDGSAPPPRVYFREGCHYHGPSRTFRGVLDWSREKDGATWDGAPTWQIVMRFSSDLRYVAGGAIVKDRRPAAVVGGDAEDGGGQNPPSQYREVHPLDGRWTVTWWSSAGPEEDGDEGGDGNGNGWRRGDRSEEIEVSASQFSLYGCDYTIQTGGGRDDPSRLVSFRWPRMPWDDGGDRVVQTAVGGVDLGGSPCGPPVGGDIVWTTTDADHPRITWLRESIGPPPPPKVDMFGPQHNFYKQLRPREVDEAQLPKYHPESIWGNVFVQSMKVGLASYHFVSEDGVDENGAYISYENPLCSVWPPLDDGAPIPLKMPFSDVEFDDASRTFKGTIRWKERHGTTWTGATAWRYEMLFDSEYTCIVSGKVHTIAEGGAETEWSRFGQELVYINAAVMDRFSMLSEQDEGPQVHDFDVDALSRDLRCRLEREGASQVTISILRHLLTRALRREPNLIDFNL